MLDRRPGVLDGYRAILSSRLRAQQVYRLSFLMDMLGTLLVGLTELAEVWVIMHSIDALGGLTLPAMILLFGICNLSWALADLVVGHLDEIPRYLRAGTLEVFYVRPLPVLLQLVTSEVSLRRLGRLTVGLACLVAGLLLTDVPWSGRAVAILALAVVCGSVIFAALFIAAAGVQFWLINAPEMTNAFTYGGSYAAQQPARVFPPWLRWLFLFVIPVSWVAYVPTLGLLGLPGPAPLPTWAPWCLPAVAALTLAAALGLWRLGSRHYQGGGG